MNSVRKGYKGNPQIKKARTQIEWSDELKEEWLKCKEDPIYFAEKYIHVIHVDRGFIKIELYDYQKEIITKITSSRRVSVVTSRQAGKTTTAACIILHYILFNRHKLVGLLAQDAAGAREILDRIKQAYEALPEWLQQGVIEWNKGRIELENGCKVLAAATRSSTIRGKSCAFIYIDEVAFVDKWDDFFKSVYPTISSGDETKLLLTSTPNGLNHFYRICDGAKNMTNGYEYVEVPWNQVPGRGEEWFKETMDALNGDVEAFEQEYNCGFLGTSSTLIAGSVLKTLASLQPEFNLDDVQVFDSPLPEHKYVLVADASRGKGLDYNACSIIDITKIPYVQVAVYRNNKSSPAEYAGIIYRLSKYYNEANVLVENNDGGGCLTLSALYNDYEYENVLSTESDKTRGRRVSGGYSKSAELGVRTTSTVKSVGCSMLKLLVEQRRLIVKDEETIYELRRFSQKGNSYAAESGAHDDLVMGLVLFGWLSEQDYFKNLTNINTIMSLTESSHEQLDRNYGMLMFRTRGGPDDDLVKRTVDMAEGIDPDNLWIYS